MINPPSMQDILNAVENLQSNMQKTQDNLAQTKIIGSCDTGEDSSINVEFIGQYVCKKIQLPEDFITLEKSLFESMLTTAINDAMNKIKELTQGEIETLSEDLKEKK